MKTTELNYQSLLSFTNKSKIEKVIMMTTHKLCSQSSQSEDC